MTSNNSNFNRAFLVVGDKPLCFWDVDIKQKNRWFLERFDPDYFEHMAQVHWQIISEAREPTDKKVQYAAMALRALYSQTLETLFAHIFASLQAFYCPPVWFNEYTNQLLNKLITQVHNKETIYSIWEMKSSSWSSIAEILLQPLLQRSTLEDKEYESTIKEGFAKAWSHLAIDFLDDGHSREYNSIKHGLRAFPGGFKIRVGIPDEPGVQPPEHKMVTLASSKFGSSYLVSEKLEGLKHHVQLKERLRNWNPENIVAGIKLAAISIGNIHAFLRLVNNEVSAPISLRFPDPSEFERQPDYTNMTFSEVKIQPEWITPFSKEDILASYTNNQWIILDEDKDQEV